MQCQGRTISNYMKPVSSALHAKRQDRRFASSSKAQIQVPGEEGTPSNCRGGSGLTQEQPARQQAVSVARISKRQAGNGLAAEASAD